MPILGCNKSFFVFTPKFISCTLKWLIDFNSISRVILCLEVRELHSYLHFLCNFFHEAFYLFTFYLHEAFYLFTFYLHFFFFYTHSYQIWPIDEILTSTTTLGQSGPGSNGNKGILQTIQSTKTHHQTV